MRVLALAGFPSEAAATRFRIDQLRAPLQERGIHLDVRPFLDATTYAHLYDRDAWPTTLKGLARATARRTADLLRARRYDCVLVQREAMLFGPPLVEWLTKAVDKVPIVLDLDDATYVHYDSPVYGRTARLLKWPGKTDTLIDYAQAVTCGSDAVADYVRAKGTRAWLVPTVVDPNRWTPRNHDNKDDNDVPVIGWIGSHTTFPYLETITPALERLATNHRFRLLIVGSGRTDITFANIDVDVRPWSQDTERDDFRSLDIGLYPLPADDDWAAGKSGFKAIQYLTVGVPYVASPVGAAKAIGEPNVTHLEATTTEEWETALAHLLDDPNERDQMGKEGRRHALEHYTLDHAADPLAEALRAATE